MNPADDAPLDEFEQAFVRFWVDVIVADIRAEAAVDDHDKPLEVEPLAEQHSEARPTRRRA